MPSHGGSRPGAGRPKRKDGRTKQIIVIMATDAEAQTIRQLSTDERRIALLEEVYYKHLRTTAAGHEAKETE